MHEQPVSGRRPHLPIDLHEGDCRLSASALLSGQADQGRETECRQLGGRTGKSVIRAIDFHDTNGRLLKSTYFVGGELLAP